MDEDQPFVGDQSPRIHLDGDSLTAANHVGEPPQVEVKETSIGNVSKTISVAPIRVNIYQFPVATAGQ